MKRRSLIKAFTLSASIAAMGPGWSIQAAETIKVGILHSLSGTWRSPRPRSRTWR
jgi:urea transport system substrate-binding protein